MHKQTALVVDSGARGSALKFGLERGGWNVYVTPGNTQTYREGVPHPSQPDEILSAFRGPLYPDMVVIGPEAFLEAGLADAWHAAGNRVIGPSRLAARLETSKGWARRFMRRHHIPHPRFRIFDDELEAHRYFTQHPDSVVKADGLAAGKAVTVPDSPEEGIQAIQEAMVEGKFGKAGRRIVIEDRMYGPEVCFQVLSDGKCAIPLKLAGDKKRRLDGDRGPNTGSMGAFCPSPVLTDSLIEEAMEDIVLPTIRAMAYEGYPFSGFLYVSLMLTAEGLKVVEFNVRPGDPEILVVLPLLLSNFAELLWASTKPEGLKKVELEWSNQAAVCVVLAHDWYPGKGETGSVITGLDDAANLPDTFVFHAGTTLREGEIVSAGGRVVDVVGLGVTLAQARQRAYQAAGLIHFQGKAFRTDIALGL